MQLICLILISALVCCQQMSSVKGKCTAKLESALLDDLLNMMLRIKGTARGRVIQINEIPAFTAYLSSSQSLSAGTIVTFNKVWTNNMNGYNTANGIFTAPKAGIYEFSAAVMSESGKNLFLRIWHNNTKTAGVYMTDKGYKHGTINVILDLKKGDRVYLKSGNNGQRIFSDGDNYSTFSGHLIAQ